MIGKVWPRESAFRALSSEQKDLYVCVCLRHTLCTGLARVPYDSTTVEVGRGGKRI